MSLLSQHSFQQTQAAIKDLISVARTAVPRHRKYQKKTTRLQVRNKQPSSKHATVRAAQGGNLISRKECGKSKALNFKFELQHRREQEYTLFR